MFLHLLDGLVGQDAPVGADHAFAVFLGSYHRVDIHGFKSSNAVNGNRLRSQIGFQYLVQIGGWVGADQQHLFSASGQSGCHGTGHGGFTYTTFAGEKQETSRFIQ